MELFLQILKFASLAVGTASGLIGTLRETKEKGTDRLTKSGRLLVSLLVISGFIAISSQSIESYLKHKADVRNEIERQRQIEETQALLLQASRQLAPLYPLDVTMQISYPKDYKGFKAYFEWLVQRHKKQNQLLLAIPVSRGSNDVPDETRNSLEYPAKVLLEPWIEISFFKKGNENWNSPDLVLMGGRDLNRPDLWLGAYGGVGIESMQTEHQYDSNASFTYSLVRPEEGVISNLTLRNPLVKIDNGEILSYLDLDQATMIVDITNSRNADGNLGRMSFGFKSGGRKGTVTLSQQDIVQWEGFRKEKEVRPAYRIVLKSNNSGVSRFTE